MNKIMNKIKSILPIAIVVIIIGVSFAYWIVEDKNENNTITTGSIKEVDLDKSGAEVYFIGSQNLLPGESANATLNITKSESVTNYVVKITNVKIDDIVATSENTAGLYLKIADNDAQNIASVTDVTISLDSFNIIVNMADDALASVLADKNITFTIEIVPV
jgi:hypothetical protein